MATTKMFSEARAAALLARRHRELSLLLRKDGDVFGAIEFAGSACELEKLTSALQARARATA